MTGFEAVQASASVATAVGVLIAGWQLWLAKQQARAQFEDQLSAQYREIIRRLPLSALLSEELSEEDYRRHLEHFYHYFDLSNEQAFLRRAGRISRRTWRDWQEGIVQNLRRPAFRRAWEEISRRSPENFDDLRLVLGEVGASRGALIAKSNGHVKSPAALDKAPAHSS